MNTNLVLYLINRKDFITKTVLIIKHCVSVKTIDKSIKKKKKRAIILFVGRYQNYAKLG